MSQYPIPDDYIVETKFSERSFICKIKYISVSKVCYTINWKIGHAEWSVSSTQSSTAVVNTFLQKINLKSSTKSSGPRLFGFDIEPLYHARLQISFGRDVQKAVDELIVKHKLTNLSGELILYLQHIGFNCKENQVCINFKDSNSMTIQTKLDVYIDTLVNNYEVENGAYHSLSTLLKILIPVWKGRENPVIISGDILHIKLGRYGRNVGRKQNHVMVTFCLLNEKDDVLKPNHQYSICLYIGKKKYETLDKVGKIFALQLADLKENRIIDDDGVHWPVEFYFSGD
ncbi:hypothetical protein RhiirC2_787463 [Rhizophagus irregularis]|uniref:Uncharacterized protein n=1 Tax=Rhizophagus irregularis TaxID=588596 RepID=A0A2N1MS44_9GLOM|nr:hypothetical protein RhiirC2_787463 [Rhizophagus irregularis]